MYIAVFDDKGNELPLGRRSLFEINFRLSPPQHDCDAYTIINRDQIVFDRSRKDRLWAACLGVCQQSDATPFAIVPLEHGRLIRKEETLAVAPGKLQFSISNIKPAGKQEPDPDPNLRRTTLTN